MLKLLVLAVLLPALCYGGRVNFYPCTNSYPGGTPTVPTWVEVQDCEGTTCNIPAGRGTYLRAAFSPAATHDRLRFNVRVFMDGGIEAPLEALPELEDACQFMDNGCPVHAGQESITELTFSYPITIFGVALRIEVDLQDVYNNNASVVCGGVSVVFTPSQA